MDFPADIDQFVPHTGDMSLLDRVLNAGDDWLEAEVSIRQDSLFLEPSGVPAWVGLEYLAQGIAAYSGYHESLMQSGPKIGFLVGTRKYESSNEYFLLGEVFTIKVHLELQAENGLHVFACQMQSDRTHAFANINVFQPNNVEAFLNEFR